MPLKTAVLFCVFTLIMTGCSQLREKKYFRIGLAKRTENIAPYLYGKYLPKNIKISLMPLNNHGQLKTALLVEAIDLAVLPARVLLNDPEEIKQFKVICAVAQSNESEDGMLLLMVAKAELYKQHQLKINQIINAHEQATLFLKNDRQAWVQIAVDHHLEERTVRAQLAGTVLLWSVDSDLKSKVRMIAKDMVAKKQLPEEPDFEQLW